MEEFEEVIPVHPNQVKFCNVTVNIELLDEEVDHPTPQMTRKMDKKKDCAFQKRNASVQSPERNVDMIDVKDELEENVRISLENQCQITKLANLTESCTF